MKIFSADVNGRVKTAAGRQLDAVLEHDPDVMALQEVTIGNYSDWCRGLTQAGYSVLSTVDLVALPIRRHRWGPVPGCPERRAGASCRTPPL